MNAESATVVDELLADLAAAGCALTARGIKLIITPAEALTPELIERIREHKAALMDFARLNGPCESCGSTTFNDFQIHNGQSIRRDCVCGHTRGFPRWYDKAALAPTAAAGE